MPYSVFALKWRPQTFDEIIGQSHIVSTLKNAVEKKRLANAYLFAGPRGVGKTSTARILAKSLNCKEGPTSRPCSKCPGCLEISQGRSLDVIEIDGASNRGIDEIRTLRENVKFAPVSGKFKIYIIDEVHMLTTEAFNALLKTLEEPPEYVKFIFATTQPNKVISTILSRCQRLDFRRITMLEIISQLEKIAGAEKIDFDKEVLLAIAKASDGSLRDAESILDQLVSFSQGKISLADVISVLGLVEQEALFEITEKIIRKDPKATLEIFNRLIESGKDTGVFLANLIEHFRNLMIAKVTKGDVSLIDLPREICEKLTAQSEAFNLEEIFIAFNILMGMQEMGKRMESGRIPLEIGLVKLAHDKKNSSARFEAPAETVREKHNDPVTEGVAQTQKKDNPSGPVSLEQIKESWGNIVDKLSRIKMSAATYLKEGEIAKVNGTVLTVSFPKNLSLHKEALEKTVNKEIIEKALSENLGSNLKINFILSAQEKQKEDNANAPFIKSALDMFGGRIIKEE